MQNSYLTVLGTTGHVVLTSIFTTSGEEGLDYQRSTQLLCSYAKEHMLARGNPTFMFPHLLHEFWLGYVLTVFEPCLKI